MEFAAGEVKREFVGRVADLIGIHDDADGASAGPVQTIQTSSSNTTHSQTQRNLPEDTLEVNDADASCMLPDGGASGMRRLCCSCSFSADPGSSGGVCEAQLHCGDSLRVKVRLRPNDSDSLTFSRLASSPDPTQPASG